MFTFVVISGHAHKQLSCTKPLPWGISVHWYEDFLRAKFHDCFYIIIFYFIWFNLFSVGIVDIAIQSAGIGKYTTPTRHFNFHFAPLAVSYELFPRWNQRQLDFFSIKSNSTLKFTSEKSSWVTSEKEQLSGQFLCGLFWGSWHVLRYTVHKVTSLRSLWKSVEALGRTTSTVTDMRLTPRFNRRGQRQDWALLLRPVSRYLRSVIQNA